MMMLHQPTSDSRPTRPAWGHGGPLSIGLAPAGRATVDRATADRPPLHVAVAERRRGLRVAQARPVKLLDAVAGRTVVGQTVDVSGTGLRVELPAEAALRVGEVLGIHVGLSRIGERLANRPQLVPVRVVWVRRVTAGKRKGTLTAGVEFSTGVGAQLDAA